MKKLLIVFSFIVVLAGLWYGQGALRGYLAKAPEEVSPPALESAAPVGEIPKKSKAELLQERAMAIVSRPIYVKLTLAPVTEKMAREKIAKAADMIRENYDYDSPWLDLGAYRKLIGDYDGAITAWKFLAEIRPGSYVPLHNLGDLYAFTLKQYATGEKYFLDSLVIGPGNIQAYLALATLYGVPEFGKTDKIPGILMSGLSATNNNPLLLATLAGYYRDAGEKDLALLYFKKVLTSFPDDVSIQKEVAALEAN